MTAVFTSNGDGRGRVGGPFITIETCATAPTTTSTNTPPDAISTTPATVPSPSPSTSTPAPVTTSTGPPQRRSCWRPRDQPTGRRTSGDRWQRDEPGRSWCHRLGDRRGARRRDPPRAAVPPFAVAAGSSFTPHATRLWSGGPEGSEAPPPQQGGRAPTVPLQLEGVGLRGDPHLGITPRRCRPGSLARTTRTDVRRARPSPACRTPRSPRTTRSESPVGGESPPNGARTPADQAPPEGGCSTGSRSDEPVASATEARRCASRNAAPPHNRERQPPPSSDCRRAPAKGQRHSVPSRTSTTWSEHRRLSEQLHPRPWEGPDAFPLLPGKDRAPCREAASPRRRPGCAARRTCGHGPCSGLRRCASRLLAEPSGRCSSESIPPFRMAGGSRRRYR